MAKYLQGVVGEVGEEELQAKMYVHPTHKGTERRKNHRYSIFNAPSIEYKYRHVLQKNIPSDNNMVMNFTVCRCLQGVVEEVGEEALKVSYFPTDLQG